MRTEEFQLMPKPWKVALGASMSHQPSMSCRHFLRWARYGHVLVPASLQGNKRFGISSLLCLERDRKFLLEMRLIKSLLLFV